MIGIHSQRITKLEELYASIANALALGSPSLIEVVLQKDEKRSPKCATSPQKDGSMLSMPLEDMSPLLPLEVLENEQFTRLSPESLNARLVDL